MAAADLLAVAGPVAVLALGIVIDHEAAADHDIAAGLESALRAPGQVLVRSLTCSIAFHKKICFLLAQRSV